MFHEYRTPYRIESDRTVIRCWDPHDASKMQEAVNLSVDSLLPWMPWAKGEPRDYRTKIPLLRHFRGDFDLGNDYVFGVFTTDESEVVGGCGLHTRAGQYSLEIGYWVSTKFQNHGYATEVTRSLIKAAFELSDIDNVQIKCSTDNKPSLRVIEKVGFQKEGILRHAAKDANEVFQDLFVAIYLRSDYDVGPIRAEPVRAFSVVNEVILEPTCHENE